MVARDNCDSGRDFAQRLGIRTGGGEGEQAYLLIHSEAQAAALVDYFFSPPRSPLLENAFPPSSRFARSSYDFGSITLANMACLSSLKLRWSAGTSRHILAHKLVRLFEFENHSKFSKPAPFSWLGAKISRGF